MADTKISAFTDGTPAQPTDVIPIERGAANVRLTAAQVAGTLQVSTNSRILGRTTIGAGLYEELTAAQVKAILAIAASDVSGLATVATSGSKADVGLSSVTNDTQTKAAIVPNTLPSAGQLLIGNAGGTAYAPLSMSGDGTISSAGAITITKTGGAAFATSATTDTTNAANISSGTLPLGRLSDFVGSGASHARGIVPDPGASAGTTKFLREDATWAVPPSPGPSPLDIQWYGSGADGDVTISSGTTTLTADAYYHNLTISGTGVLVTAGFKVFVSGTLDLTNAPAGAIQYNGVNGLTATTSTGGAIPGATATQTVGGAPTGTAGGNGGTAAGSNSSLTSSNIAITGGVGGQGGTGGTGTSGAGGSGSVIVTPTPSFVRRAVAELTHGATLKLGGQGGSGGGGGGGDGTAAGGGGSAATGGGVIWIAAKTIARGASTAAGAIQANSGTGGSGANAAAGNRGGGGGGGGSGGGFIYILFGALTGSSATNAIQANGGTGGNGGTGTGTGTNGTGGSGGAGGLITLINLASQILSETFGSAGSGPTGTAGGAGGTCSASL